MDYDEVEANVAAGLVPPPEVNVSQQCPQGGVGVGGGDQQPSPLQPGVDHRGQRIVIDGGMTVKMIYES